MVSIALAISGKMLFKVMILEEIFFTLLFDQSIIKGMKRKYTTSTLSYLMYT